MLIIICSYICIHIIIIYVLTNAQMHMHTYYMHACKNIRMYVCMYMHTHTHMYMYVCMYAIMNACMCKRMYVGLGLLCQNNFRHNRLVNALDIMLA